MRKQKNFVSLTLVLISALSILSDAVIAQTCTFEDVSPQKGRSIQILQLDIDLGEGSTTSWEGPVIIKERGQMDYYLCSFGLSVVHAPLTLVANRYLYVPTVDGSDWTLTVLDLEQCRTAWQSPVFYGNYEVKNNAIYVKGRALALEKSCLPSYEFDARPQEGLSGG
jgi:hypothetical protein